MVMQIGCKDTPFLQHLHIFSLFINVRLPYCGSPETDVCILKCIVIMLVASRLDI